MNIFTIDGGTTNTRIAWVCDGEVKEQIKIPCGAGTTAETGNNKKLCYAISEGIRKMSEYCEVSEIAVSGMCTSELGIFEVPHIMAPADVKTLADNAITIRLPQVSNHLFHLIPGIKCGINSLESWDMMRGEETEFFGLCKSVGLSGAVLAVFPGTHTKLVQSDECGRIISCTTTMGGEMMNALSENTILKKSLQLPFTETFYPDYLKKGYNFAKEYGLSKALFKVRIMQTNMKCRKEEANSFFAGVVLETDIALIANALGNSEIIIGGSVPLNKMIGELIRFETGRDVTIADFEKAEKASASGAYEVFKKIENKSYEAGYC